MSLVEKYNNINSTEFTSNKHTSQTRVFGYITTNIRNINGMSTYIEELVPEYIKLKDNPQEWLNWCYYPDNLSIYKQYFTRLALAKILYRNVVDCSYMNDNAVRLYEIIEKYGREYLNLLLSFYLLSGKYWGVENQPLIEIEKILNSFNGNLEEEVNTALQIDTLNSRLLLAMVLYNPNSLEGYDIAFQVLENDITNDELNFLYTELNNSSSILHKKYSNAGGINNFRYDVATIYNYYLFKQAFEDKSCKIKKLGIYEDEAIEKYVESFFECGLNTTYNITDQKKLATMLIEEKNLFQDIIDFSLGFKEDIVYNKSKKRKTHIKKEARNKYNGKCFYDFCGCDSEIHEAMYFTNKNNERYLELHHMIQLQNSKFFTNNKDIDIVENLFPLCPNCHRKIHEGANDIVSDMLKVFYDNVEKADYERKGIYVSLQTLGSFYGIEDLE